MTILLTKHLDGQALAWAVARCEGREDPIYSFAPEPADKDYVDGEDYSSCFYISGPAKMGPYEPHTQWQVGGPLIERERIETTWTAMQGWVASRCMALSEEDIHQQTGPTPLVAAMRCYVSSKFGNEVDVPEMVARSLLELLRLSEKKEYPDADPLHMVLDDIQKQKNRPRPGKP